MNWDHDRDSDTLVGKNIPGKAAVRRMEYILADHCDRAYCMAICNATMGLWAVFRALGVAGGEVIVPSLTWPGSLSGLLELGCTFRFCDVDADTGNMDPDCLKDLVGPETRAVLTVDLWGYPCRLDAIREICDDNGIWLIHDAAQSFGSYYKGAQSGKHADATVYSFGDGKLFSAGEGGCVVTDHKELYERLLWTAAHPNRQLMELTASNPFPVNLGMSPFAAQHIIDNLEATLQSIASRSTDIRRRLETIGIAIGEGCVPNFHRIVLPENKAKAMANNDMKRVRPISYQQPVYALMDEQYSNASCPIAEEIIRKHKRVIWG